MLYATNTAVRPSCVAAEAAAPIVAPGSSPAGHSAAGWSAIRFSDSASCARPCLFHISICWAAGLAGSTQKGDWGCAVGVASWGARRTTEASSTPVMDEQPAASPSTASAAKVRISRDILPP